MKKIEKKFFDKNCNLTDSCVDFNTIKSQINFDSCVEEKTYSPKKRTRFIEILAFCFCTSLIIGIVVPSILVNSKNEDLPGNNPLALGINIENINAIVTEYEKNTSFVSNGYQVSNLLENGKTSLVDSNDILVDYSEFKEGVVGKYNIKLKNREGNHEVNYLTEVVDLEVVEIKLESYQQDYYIGENIFPQDLEVIKVRSDGSKVKVKSTELVIDDSNFNNERPGTYSVNVSLQSNSSFNLTYQVNVKEYDQNTFDGRYSYIDNTYTYGAPNIYAFEINDGVISSFYSEILLNGELEYVESDQEIILSRTGSSQTMKYNPQKRSFIVSGIAGDPDMECFRLSSNDYIVDLKGQLVPDGGDNYVTKDGSLPISTYNYLSHVYGDIYLDSQYQNKVNQETNIDSDLTLWVGKPSEINQEQETPFVGIWYRPNWGTLVYLEEDMTLHSGNKDFSKPYTASKNSDNTYTLRSNSFQVMIFDPVSDTLNMLSPETGEIELVYFRFDSETQIIVSLRFDDYILQKGEVFNPVEINDYDVSWYEVIGYHGEPLYENTSFEGSNKYSNYMSDFTGIMFGDINHYFEINSNDWDDRLETGHQYILVEYENFKEVNRGYIRFANIDFKNISYYFEIEPINGNEKYLINIKTNYDDNKKVYFKTLTINNTNYNENKYPFNNLPFVGSYFSEDGSKLLITKEGNLGEVKKLEASTTIEYKSLLIKSISDEEIVFLLKNYYEPEVSSRFEYYELKVELIDGKYTFTYNNKQYIKSETSSDA